MDALPNEILHYIFRFLRRRDLLNSRIVCSKWNPILLAALDWSNLKIGFLKNKETEDFCKLMKRSAGGLNFQTIFFSLSSYSENLYPWNDPINVSNYKQLSNEIAPSAVAYYFNLDCMWPSEFDVRCSEVINIMLNATLPNLRILHLKSQSVFPEPGFHPLNNLSELGLESPVWHIEFDVDVVRKWMTKAPNLKKFRSNIEYSKSSSSSSKISEYFQLLQGIPEVAIDVYLVQNHENQLLELSLITITELQLNVEVGYDGADGDIVCRALNLFFKTQSQHLQILQIQKLLDLANSSVGTISSFNNLTLPFLPKLKTFEMFNYDYRIFNGAILPFGPNIFKILQNLNLGRDLPSENLFRGYSTVTKLIVDKYLVKDWKTMFPRIKKFKTYTKDLNDLRQILSDPPTIHHLVLKIPADTELIHCLIYNSSSVAKLEIELCTEGKHRLLLEDTYLGHVEEPRRTLEKELIRKDTMELWNVLTGYARIESDRVFLIRGVNDTTEITMEMNMHRSIADIKNLWKLRGEATTVLIKATAYLSQQQGSFVNLKKMVLHRIPSDIHDYWERRYISDYQYPKSSMWNFDVEIRFDGSYNQMRTLRFSKKKIPKYMLSYVCNSKANLNYVHRCFRI